MALPPKHGSVFVSCAEGQGGAGKATPRQPSGALPGPQECYDTMEAKIVIIHGMIADLEVPNFNVRLKDKKAAALLKKIKFMRKVQLEVCTGGRRRGCRARGGGVKTLAP